MQSDAYINLVCHKSVLHVGFFNSNGTVLLFCTESLKLDCTLKSLRSDISEAAWIVLGERFIFGYLQSHFLQETILNRNIAITYMQTQSEITFSVLKSDYSQTPQGQNQNITRDKSSSFI